MGAAVPEIMDGPFYIVDLAGELEVRWDGGHTKLAGKNSFLLRKWSENHELGSGFCA
jgi:hypothetical protein